MRSHRVLYKDDRQVDYVICYSATSAFVVSNNGFVDNTSSDFCSDLRTSVKVALKTFNQLYTDSYNALALSTAVYIRTSDKQISFSTQQQWTCRLLHQQTPLLRALSVLP